MKKLMYIVLLIINYSCQLDWDKKEYRQFTSDDLHHLYYNKDTLTYTGQQIYYGDTIYFLLNKTDTIKAPVVTSIRSWLPISAILNTEDICGQSDIYLPKSTGFRYIDIHIDRRTDSGYLERRFEVGLFNTDYNGFQKIVYSYESFPLDTMMVLNKLYSDVYKFHDSTDNNKSRIKSVYFAKKYGYIKIESTDGIVLELIKIMKIDSTNINQ